MENLTKQKQYIGDIEIYKYKRRRCNDYLWRLTL